MFQEQIAKYTRIISIALICICIISTFCGCSKNKAPEEIASEKTVNSGSLSVERILPYSGKFVEDGSDEDVENIVAAVLSNTTSTDYEYVEFSVTTDKGIHNFVATTVKSGSTMTVLCKDKFENSESMQSFSIDVQAEYVTPVSLAEGILEIYYTDQTVSLRNSSDKDLNNISVFYKQRNDSGYLGGITYKTTISSLKSGEITQLNSGHMDEIVNIRYYG